MGIFPAMQNMGTGSVRAPSAPDSSTVRRAFCLCVLCLAVFQFSENTADPDLWAHVLFGQHFLQTGALMKTDPYSWTANGHEWMNHEVVGEVALGLAHRWLGGTGLLLLKMAVGLLTFGIALSIATGQMSRSTRVTAWAFGALAVVEISFGFAARPQIFSALALAVQFWITREIHRGRCWWALALPPLFVLWINTHGGVLAGVFLLFVTAAATTTQFFLKKQGPAAIRSGLDTESSARVVVTLWIAAAAATASLLLNPWGFGLIRWLIGSVLWLRPEIDEWNSAKPELGSRCVLPLCRPRSGGVSFVTAAAFPVADWRNGGAGPHGISIRAAHAAVLRRRAGVCAAASGGCPAAFSRPLPAFGRSRPKARRAENSRGFFYARFCRHHRGGIHPAQRAGLDDGSAAPASIPYPRCNSSANTGCTGTCWYSLTGAKCASGNCPTAASRWMAGWTPVTRARSSPPTGNFTMPNRRREPRSTSNARILLCFRRHLPVALALVKQHGWQAAYLDNLAVVLVKNPGQFPKLDGLDLPMQGDPQATQGRAAFPASPSLRITGNQ